MRVLVVGAGAIGGYFGGRLHAAGRDVTFLVRARRAAQLARDGLLIRSPCGDVQISAPPHVVANDLRTPFDLVLLSCKAYDLDAAMEDIAPAVGATTTILPLLNGMCHLEALDARFGAGRVLGGQCAISAMLDRAGTIVHLGALHALSFGERDGTRPPRIAAIAALMQDAGFDARASDNVLLDMWEKFVLLATLAGTTCLMRAAVGDVVAAGGGDRILALLEECRATAAASGYAPRPRFMARAEAMLTAPGSLTTASMLRDIEQGGPIEADHIIGDLLRRHDALVGTEAPLLRTAWLHLSAYEARRLRQAAAP
jgi:2-dehydropantoate 2-reductase